MGTNRTRLFGHGSFLLVLLCGAWLLGWNARAEHDERGAPDTAPSSAPASRRSFAFPNSDRTLQCAVLDQYAIPPNYPVLDAAYVADMHMNLASERRTPRECQAALEKLLAAYRQRHAGIGFGTYLSATGVLRPDQAKSWPIERVPLERVAGEELWKPYLADSSPPLGYVAYDRDATFAKWVDLLVRELRSPQRAWASWVFFDEVSRPPCDPNMPFERTVAMLRAVRRQYGKPIIANVASGPEPISRQQAELLVSGGKAVDAVCLEIAFRGTEPNGYRWGRKMAGPDVREEIANWRLWLDHGVAVMLIAPWSPWDKLERVLIDERFLAGLAMMARQPGDAIHVMRPFQFGDADKSDGVNDWGYWPKTLGAARGACEMSASAGPTIVWRRFEHGVMRIDLSTGRVSVTPK